MKVTKQLLTTITLEKVEIPALRRALLLYLTDLYGDKPVPPGSELARLYEELDDGTNMGKFPPLHRALES